MTFCMNVSRFMNLAAIFSLDLESQCKYTIVLEIGCQAKMEMSGQNQLKKKWKTWTFSYLKASLSVT